jgi:hypothetical protein
MNTYNNDGFEQAHERNGFARNGSNTGNTVVVAALAYHRRGWAVVVLDGKRPKTRAWQKARYDETELPRVFAGKHCNIGIRLGEVSGGLADVDLDCAEARAHASTFLPPTPAVFGRKSTPRSHRLYIVAPPSFKTLRLADPDAEEGSSEDHKGAIVELRGDGAQTMVPPSVHPLGEIVGWESDFAPIPATAELEVLRAAVHKVAAASMLSRRWPKIQRHDAAMALAGALRQGGWNADDATRFVLAVAEVGGDEELDDRRRAIEDTIRKFDAREPIVGAAKCRELFGGTWAKAAGWLRLRGGSTGAPAIPYEATPSGIVHHRQTPGGERVTTPLCNFLAWIKADIENNDGVESSRHFEIELSIRDTKKTFVIPAKDFTSFNWLQEKGGSAPSIYAGNGNRDRVRDAVQRLSTGTIERVVRTHTGWTLVNGVYVLPSWRWRHRRDCERGCRAAVAADGVQPSRCGAQ